MSVVIPVEAIGVADGIGLHEPAEGWGIPAGFGVLQADFGEPSLARVLEPADVGRGGDAELVIGVDAQHIAATVGHRDDATALVRLQEAAVRRAIADIPHDRLVGARAGHIALGDSAARA